MNAWLDHEYFSHCTGELMIECDSFVIGDWKVMSIPAFHVTPMHWHLAVVSWLRNHENHALYDSGPDLAASDTNCARFEHTALIQRSFYSRHSVTFGPLLAITTSGAGSE